MNDTISLGGKSFPVRYLERVRYVKDRGRWLKHTSFVDRLAAEGRWAELRDLALEGLRQPTIERVTHGER